MKEEAFDFREVENERTWNWGEYLVDFSTSEHRKYKEVDGVRTYEHGLVEIHSHAYCRPDLRSRLFTHYGIRFELVRKVSGVQYFTPDRQPVTKTSLLDSSINMLMYDTRHRMALARSHDYPIVYYGPHARPSGGAVLCVRTHNEEQYQKNLRALQEVRNFALTYRSMTDRNDLPGSGYFGDYAISEWLEKQFEGSAVKGRPYLRQVKGNERFWFSLGEREQSGKLAREIRERSRGTQEVPYLYYEGDLG